MSARTANRLLSILALAAGAGCGDVPTAAPLAPATVARSAAAANATRPSPTLGVPTSYFVSGPFHDVIAFTAPTAGAYRVTVLGNTQIVGCSGRYCRSPGTLKATVSGVELQSALGTPLAAFVGTTSVTLDAGSYLLIVDGAGAGTGRYANTGNYTVTIRRLVVVIPSCDSVRGAMLTLGYSEAEIEARVSALLAMSPPGCTDD